MLNLFPKHQYFDTSVSSVYFQGLCRQEWLKDEILSVTVPTVSIDPKCQSQDLKLLVVTHYPKRNNRNVILPQTLYNLFLREELSKGGKSTDWAIPRNRVWSAGSAAVSVSQVPFHGWFIRRHHFCACYRNWGTAGVGSSYLHYSHKWAFFWMTL